jgi:hypothetical protein
VRWLGISSKHDKLGLLSSEGAQKSQWTTMTESGHVGCLFYRLDAGVNLKGVSRLERAVSGHW